MGDDPIPVSSQDTMLPITPSRTLRTQTNGVLLLKSFG
jgi:hypothetical protein